MAKKTGQGGATENTDLPENPETTATTETQGNGETTGNENPETETQQDSVNDQGPEVSGDNPPGPTGEDTDTDTEVEPEPYASAPVGAIATHDGKEYVKLGPNDWVPAVRIDDPPLDEGATVKIKNPEKKGQKIFVGDGQIAEFNSEGIIEVNGREAARLLKIHGYKRA
jgi:hypothetical protein